MSINYKTTSAVVLQNEIKKLGPSAIGLELGVWYGYNMGHFLEECSNIKLLYGVDPYLPYQDWNRYIDESMMQAAEDSTLAILSNFPGRAQLLKMTSAQARDLVDVLDFIFIDGDHSFERCYEDLNLWYDSVRPGGLFSGHDFTLPGVNKAILQFRQERNITGFFKVVPNDVWFWIKD
jgi:predicted O-methyltransferase YrrM